MTTYIDTHAHLDDEPFDVDLDAVLERAGEAGVEAIVCPGITADSSETVVRLAEWHEELFAAVGIQPNYCGQAAGGDWERVVGLASHARVVAVGETGLDKHWDFTPFDVQQDYFDRHLRLAQERGLPVVIHCREAEVDLLAMLREAAGRGPLRGVMHSFSAGRRTAETCIDLGFYISFSGSVTYKNEKFEPIREAAQWVPAERLLLETDSPYLVPTPLRGKEKRNEPARIVHTARRVAELRGIPLEQLARQTSANAKELFGLE